MILNDPESLQEIAPENRVLLLPHCLRLSQRCHARYSRDEGLLCESCAEDCPINQIKKVAEARGFGGVCIAPGGSLALSYVKNHLPQGIVAVACNKELEMGILAVDSISNNGNNFNGLVVLTVTLERDGCVDTEVNLSEVIKAINL